MISAIVTLIFNIIVAIIKFIFRIIKKILFATRLIIPIGVGLVFVVLFALDVIEYTPINLALACILCGASFLYIIYRGIKKRISSKAPKYKQIDEKIQPRVYRVKQNPRYIMHEYPDRVELYEETKKGKKYIRTDKRR